MKKTFPKEGEQKLKDTIKKLKAERRSLIKKIRFLEEELINIQKPVRARCYPDKPLTDSEWRSNFTKKFKESLKGD